MKIITGGQTGVDRAALDAAMECAVEYGGWCPRGGWAEDYAEPPGLLASLPNLKGVISLGAGVDHVLSDPTLPDVPLCRVVDANLTTRMSEWVVMHALIHLRHQRDYDLLQRQKLWREIMPSPAVTVRMKSMPWTSILLKMDASG